MDTRAMLSQFRIPNPCPMDWDVMSGDERIRHCAGCGKEVYNLTAMSADETNSLISTVAGGGEKRCVRLYQRDDGTLAATGPLPTPHVRARPLQFTIRFLMMIIAACAALLGLSKWRPLDKKPPKLPPAANSQIIMGDIYCY